MIGFLGLMLLLASVVCLGSYWISWEGQDARTRPRFAAKIAGDCARLFRRERATTAVPRPHASVVLQKNTGAPESST